MSNFKNPRRLKTTREWNKVKKEQTETTCSHKYFNNAIGL